MHPEPVLDDDFADWLEKTGYEWGMKGIALAVTRRLKDENGEWAVMVVQTAGELPSMQIFRRFRTDSLWYWVKFQAVYCNGNRIRNQWKLQDTVAQNQANLIDILTHRIGLPRHDLSYSRTDNLATTILKLRYLKPSAVFRDIVTEAELSGRLADGFVSPGKDENIGEGKRRLIFKPVPFWITKYDSELMAGAGGVISTANDLVLWLQMLLLNGRHPVTNATIIPESPRDYGMGQMMYSYQGHNLIEHGGAITGHYSLITRAPDDGVGIAILTNAAGNGPFLELVKFKLLEKALG
ncbi:beta-lactamase/transpeptidase-like protein [Hysterangium stoloniferum]|nr:beta-lactamase/transpeptidase-like protein [Hysterangium stoloniferum]